MTVPAPSGPVTMATVCHVVVFTGNEERSMTFRSACTLGALTRAPPLTRIFPVGHEVFATSTVPIGGFGADLTGGLETTETAATVPAGPVGPTLPLAPCGPWAPVAPLGPCGPDVLAGMAATAYAPIPTPAPPSKRAVKTAGVTHFGQARGVCCAIVTWYRRVCDVQRPRHPPRSKQPSRARSWRCLLLRVASMHLAYAYPKPRYVHVRESVDVRGRSGCTLIAAVGSVTRSRPG